MATPLEPGYGMIGLAGALGVGLVFTHAAVVKFRHRHMLPGIVANYRLLPAALVAPVAYVLPIVELSIGLALLAGGARIAVLPAVALLLLFAAAIAINLRRGRSHIDCGCGRPDLRETLRWSMVIRNLALTAIVLPRLVPSTPIGSVELATAISAGTSVFLITLLFNAIAALAATPLAARRS